LAFIATDSYKTQKFNDFMQVYLNPKATNTKTKKK
jgi:hypothetical protein